MKAIAAVCRCKAATVNTIVAVVCRCKAATVNTIVAAIGLALLLCAAPLQAAQPSSSRAVDAPAAQPIPFRKDDDLGAMAWSVGLGLVIAIGVAVGVLYVLRRYLVSVQSGPGRRLRVIETVRLGPKSALFLVELDGRGLLIGQQGDNLAVLAQPEGSSANRPAHPASAAFSSSATPSAVRGDHAA